jgi:hypothetical protein
VAERKGGTTRAEPGDLPALIARLGEDIVTLLDSKLSLLKVEIKEDATAYVRGSVALAAGGIVAAVGFASLNVAFALLISALFERAALSQPTKYALGFVITGAVYLVVGLVLMRSATRRLASVDPAPERSVRELEKDKRWLG